VKRLFFVFLIMMGFAFLTAIFVSGQQSTDQAAQFRTQTNLVLVPVQVRSKGQHLSGLKQDAFTLLQDGKEQKISVFEEVRTNTDRLKRAPVGPNQFTNELTGKPESARFTVIAVDLINTKALDMNRVRDGLLKFLSQAADTGEPIRLVSIEQKGIRTIHDFTTDPKAIALALQETNKPSGKMTTSSVALNETLQELEIGATLEAAGNTDANPSALATFLHQLDNAKAAEQQVMAFQQRTSRISSLEALQQIALSLSGLPGLKFRIPLQFAGAGRTGGGISRLQPGDGGLCIR
jgi:VWFA-related protein